MTGSVSPQVVRRMVGRCSVRPALPTGFDQQPCTFGEPVNLPGEYLWMNDGECWFHRYDGGDPVKVNPADLRQICALP